MPTIDEIPKIWVAVIRHLASRPGRRIGPLFVNPGGSVEDVSLTRERDKRTFSVRTYEYDAGELRPAGVSSAGAAPDRLGSSTFSTSPT